MNFTTACNLLDAGGAHPSEGHCSEKQFNYLRDLVARCQQIKIVLEIGFNAGHSALAFLSARSDVRVVSVEIGRYEYTLKGKAVVDQQFPGRHTLLIGNSLLLLPQMRELFKDFRADLAFVDGGHDFPVPGADIHHCLQLLQPAGLLLVDDVCQHMVDVRRAVTEAVAAKRIREAEYVVDTPVQAWLLCYKSLQE